MNKRELVEAVAGRLGDKKAATEAVNAVLDVIQHAVAGGDKVSITGFGAFEMVHKPARTARNPSTGEPSCLAWFQRPAAFSAGDGFQGAGQPGRKAAEIAVIRKGRHGARPRLGPGAVLFRPVNAMLSRLRILQAVLRAAKSRGG